MMLWLPLQVVADIGAPVCESRIGAMSALAAQVMPSSPNQDVSAHGHPAQADMAATASHQAADDGAGLGRAHAHAHAHAMDSPCGDCGVACAAFAVQQVARGPQAVLGVGPAVHGQHGFASAAVIQAFEPPIAAA